MPYIHWLIFDIIDEFYSDGNSTIRRILWMDLINSYHIAGDVLYAWRSSLPSGHPLTSIVNSMYNHIAMAYCYHRIAYEANGEIFKRAFYHDVYLIVMGDDNLFAVSDYATWFTERSISNAMKHIGLKYTSDTKDGTFFTLRQFKDVTFLKRSFKWMNVPFIGRPQFYAPLDLDSIMEIPMWYREGELTEAYLVEVNIRTVLLELALHGREVYDKYNRPTWRAYRQFCEDRGIEAYWPFASWGGAIVKAITFEKQF
jgi:hypothetical protein